MLKSRLFSIFTLTLLGVATALSIIMSTNPNQNDTTIFVGLYGAIFLAISGLITLVLLTYHGLKDKQRPLESFLEPSIRIGVIFALAIDILLFLQMIRVLSWWETILLLAAAFFLNLYFKEKPKVAHD